MLRSRLFACRPGPRLALSHHLPGPDRAQSGCRVPGAGHADGGRTDDAAGRLCAILGSASLEHVAGRDFDWLRVGTARLIVCLLYTSDAADERSSVDLGGRRII